MSSKIIVTSPHPQFTELALNVSNNIGIEIKIVEAILDEAAERVAEICAKNDIAVIVSRGGTERAISKRVDVPVVSVEANDFDILIALWEARKYSESIAYLCYDYQFVPYEFESLVDIIGVEIRQIYFTSYETMISQIEAAKAEGIEVIVSGSSEAMVLASKAGLQGILVKASRRTMVNALQRAKWVEDVRENDRRKSKQLETIINLSHDGIVALDKNGTVNMMNRMAEKMLGLKREMLTNEKLSNYIMNPEFYKIIENPSETTGKVVNVNENNIIINKVAIKSNKEDYGRVITLQEVTKLEQLEHNVRRQIHSQGLTAKIFFEDIIANTEIMKKCIEKAKKYAATDGTILITGESGSGKEMFAQSIHNYSERRNNPFVAVNCAALPENLLESELFGYEEGSFTGARKGGKPGLFELAHKGTLFLDELASVPQKVQVQLLRVLQERQVFRIGGDKVIPVDVRIIAATNEALKDVVEAGKFRFDLYYRLNVLNIEIPPLRERIRDIPDLVNYFIGRLNSKLNKRISTISPELMEIFLNYNWPGNIRELMNCLERLVIMSEDGVIGIDAIDQIEYSDAFKDLSEQKVTDRKMSELDNKDILCIDMGSYEEVEKQILKWYDNKFNGNKTRIAQELGICRTTLWKKLKKSI